MYNNFETDEIIADAIGESFNIPTGVTMWGWTQVQREGQC